MNGLEHFKLDSLEYIEEGKEASEKEENEPIVNEEEKEQDIEKENNDDSSTEEKNEEELNSLRDSKIEEIEAKKDEERTQEEQDFLKQFKPEKGLNSTFRALADQGVLEIDESKEYEDSPEGVQEIIVDNIKIGIDKYKDKLPEDVKGLLTFVENGGDPKQYEDFLYEEDYSIVDTTNKTNQQILVRDYYSAQGLSEEDIQEKIQLFEENNKLEKEAELAKTSLSKSQKLKREKLEQEQIQKAEQIRTERKKNIDEFKSKVENLNEIAGFKLTKKESKNLVDYMIKPISNGKSQYQIDSSDLNNQIAQAYLLQKKFDFNKLEKKIATNKVAELRKSLDNLSKGAASKKGTTAQTQALTKGDDKLVLNVPSFMYATSD